MLVALVVGGAAWFVVQRGRGTLTSATAESGVPQAVAHLAGERITLVQVSSEHCASCARGARIWREAIAGEGGEVGAVGERDRAGAAFVEIDAADHMDLVRELGIMTTPTTLVYDGDGVLRGRVAGAPTPRAALAVLAPEQDGALR